MAGLTTNAVAVWDVSDPASPCVLDAPVWQAADGTWSTAFLCGGAAARYAVFGAPSGAFAPSRHMAMLYGLFLGQVSAAAAGVPLGLAVFLVERRGDLL